MTDEMEIRDILAQQGRAIRAKDPEALVGRYAPNVKVCDLAPPLQRTVQDGLDVERLRAWLAGFEDGMDYEVHDPVIVIGGDVAYTQSLNRLTATPKGMSEPFDLWHRQTLCLEKTGGTWRITVDHRSVPFLMDGTFLAAVDLKP